MMILLIKDFDLENNRFYDKNPVSRNAFFLIPSISCIGFFHK